MARSKIDLRKVENALKRAGRVAVTGSDKERSGSIAADNRIRLLRDNRSGRFVAAHRISPAEKA